jgi:hypothetical protein
VKGSSVKTPELSGNGKRRTDSSGSHDFVTKPKRTDAGWRLKVLSRQGWVRGSAILGAWILLGLFISAQNYVLRLQLGRPLTIPYSLALGLGHCALWAAATPLILFLIRRFKLERPLWVRHLLVHVLASLTLTLSINLAHHFLIYLAFSSKPGMPFNFLLA